MLRCELMLKYLRIAVTALSLTACVLLVAMWVRSYRQIDNLYVRLWDVRTVNFNSGIGQFAIDLQSPRIPWNHNRNWRFVTQPAAPIREAHAKLGVVPPTFRAMQHPTGSILLTRCWIPVAMTGFIAAAIGIPWAKRFSLRTLLIATTLVAVGLGIIISMS